MRFFIAKISVLLCLSGGQSLAQSRHPDYGVFDIPVDERTWAALDELGAGWVREQFRMGEADLDRAMLLYERIFSEGYGLMLTLYHRDAGNIADQQSFEQSTRGSYPPVDPVRYRQLVRQVVGRLVQALEEQGKDLDDFLMIQFCNEVMPTDILPDNPVRFWHGTQEAYLETLTLTYDAVKSIPSWDIPVVAGGISSAVMELVVDYDRGVETDPIVGLISEFNDRLLREGRFDWADVHLRHAIEEVGSKIDWVKARWTGPLAASEFAGPDVRTAVTFSESLQAEELVARMRLASGRGVDKVFWSHLVENPAVEDIYFQEGLIAYDTWRKKPAFFAYQRYLEEIVTSTEKGFRPVAVSLYNYPNPFIRFTTIRLKASQVIRDAQLRVFDSKGKLLFHKIWDTLTPGTYDLEVNGFAASAGIYSCVLVTSGATIVHKMVHVR